MRVDGPRDLPDLRLELLDAWRPGGVLRQAQAILNPMMAQDSGLGDDFTLVAHIFDQRALSEASLWYVSEDMTDLVQAAAPTLPPTTLTPELLPAKCGLVVFAKHLMGLSADEHEITEIMGRPLTEDEIAQQHRPLEVDALLWGDSETLGIRIARREYIGIAAYRCLNMGEMGWHWMPLGRTDWNYGDDTEEPVDPKLVGHDIRLASMAEDRRWAAALWLLASQARVGIQTPISPQRSAARRSQREGLSAEVRLIDVRRKPAEHSDESEGRHVEWSHRWLVNPHWRQQAYGPNRSLRRPVFILPHVKGPADKPLVIKPAVNVIRE